MGLLRRNHYLLFWITAIFSKKQVLLKWMALPYSYVHCTKTIIPCTHRLLVCHTQNVFFHIRFRKILESVPLHNDRTYTIECLNSQLWGTWPHCTFCKYCVQAPVYISPSLCFLLSRVSHSSGTMCYIGYSKLLSLWQLWNSYSLFLAIPSFPAHQLHSVVQLAKQQSQPIAVDSDRNIDVLIPTLTDPTSPQSKVEYMEEEPCVPGDAESSDSTQNSSRMTCQRK